MKVRKRYMALDIETTREFSQEDDWHDHRPVGIACAAIHSEETGTITWFSADDSGEIANQMTREDLELMVLQLRSLQRDQGYTLVTWNGLGFDFDVIAEESGLQDACRELALDHVDMMFHVFCKRGYPIGLSAAAAGMEVEGKTEGMDGEKAVRMWLDGEREDVIEYCGQDTVSTLQVALAAETTGSLRWKSQSGRNQSMTMRAGWLTVRQALKTPQPDTSWMTDPMPRAQFTSWLNRKEGEMTAAAPPAEGTRGAGRKDERKDGNSNANGAGNDGRNGT